MKQRARNLLRFLTIHTKFRGRHRLVSMLMPYLQPDHQLTVGQMDNDLSMYFDLQDRTQNYMYYGVYEEVQRELIVALLMPGDIFFDLGAHIGYFTLPAAKKVTEKGAVHAFEALDSNVAMLEQSVQMNGFKNVHINHVAVSDAVGTATLSTPDSEKYHSGVSGWSTIMDFFPEASSKTIETTSLDAYVLANQVPSIDLIKMDIEAAEVLALKGMKQILESSIPPRILSEVNAGRLRDSGYDPNIIHKILLEYGYTSFLVGHVIQEVKTPSSDEAIESFLFLPQTDPLLPLFKSTPSARQLIDKLNANSKI